MAIKFVVTDSLDDLTWEEWNALEEGIGKKVREILARYMVDEDGKKLEYREAMKRLGALKMKEIGAVTSAFWKALREHSVNPPTGG